MGYNKAKEEKKWRLWKEAEEKELRRLGVCKDVIKRLRDADWKDFKTERRFFDHYVDTDTYIDRQAAGEALKSIRTVQDLLDDIDYPALPYQSGINYKGGGCLWREIFTASIMRIPIASTNAKAASDILS